MTTFPQDRMRLAHTAASLIESVWHSAADVVATAPGRVNIIGEHTDYAGGCCLPFALPQATAVALTPRTDLILRVHSVIPGADPLTYEAGIDEAQSEDARGQWWSYVFGVFWALRDAGFTVRGADIAITSDVPVGAGVSSSAALGCSVAMAARHVFGHADALEMSALAQICMRAENEVVGAATGGLDQRISLGAKSGHAMLLDFSTGACEHVAADLTDDDACWLVIDTRQPHALHDGAYAQRRRWCTEAANFLGVANLSRAADLPKHDLAEKLVILGRSDALNATRHVLSENARVHAVATELATRDEGFLERVGQLLRASHTSLGTEMGVSTAELDLAVVTACDAGAYGARLIGGGFGGSIVALVPRQRALSVLQDVQVIFAEQNLAVPTGFIATPSSAAAVISGADVKAQARSATSSPADALH